MKQKIFVVMICGLALGCGKPINPTDEQAKASPKAVVIGQTTGGYYIGKLCDQGRAVYSYSHSIAVVENARECAGRPAHPVEGK